MKEDNQNIKFRASLFWIVLATLVVLSFFILKPFIIPIVSAFVLSYLAMPIYEKIKKSSNQHIAAILTIVLLIGIVIIPVALMLSSLTSQAQSAISASDIESLTQKVKSLEIFNKLHINLEKLKENILEAIINSIGKTLKEIPSMIISVVITILATYYMLLKRDSMVKVVKEFIPFSNKDKLTSEIASATRHIMYGYFLVAFLEFIVAGVGFYAAGINNYLIFASLISMLAFIPGLGPGIVWIPTFILSVLSGDYLQAIIILATGLTISVLIETFLLSKIIGHKASIHPLILLIGILGGVPIFGIFGFIIGPIVLAYTIKILEQAVGVKKD
ncbi:MAG TPA: AI-2E family transporter [Candidatus Nanoarchaeia archaeon]|nr:AI-2E family transporter [Candidatus Nanoarchaeia archaeon]